MKKILCSTFLSLLYYAVNLFSNFWITTVLIRSLGKEAYSFYPLANNVSGWMVIISVAVNSMLSRHISVSYNKKDYNTTEQYYSTAMVANIGCTIVLSIPILIVVYSADLFLNIPDIYVNDVKILLSLVLFTVPLNMFSTVFSIASTATDRLYLEYLARLIQVVIKSTIILGCYYYGNISLIIVGISILSADCVLLFITVVIKKNIFYQIKFRARQFKKEILGIILRSGIWNSLTQLGNSLLFQCDLIISNILLGATASGIISITLTIPNAITSIITTLSSVFMPGLFREYAKYGFNKTFLKKIEYSQWIIGGITGVLILLVVKFDYEFFNLWVPGNDTKMLEQLSVYYLLPLIYSSIFRCVGNILIVANKMKTQAILTFINGLINIILMYILVNYSNLGIYSIVITTAFISFVWYVFFIPNYISKMIGCSPVVFYIAPIKVSLLLSLLYVLIASIKKRLGIMDSLIKLVISAGCLGGICYILFFSFFWTYVKRNKIYKKM